MARTVSILAVGGGGDGVGDGGGDGAGNGGGDGGGDACLAGQVRITTVPRIFQIHNLKFLIF